ncbi:MAG: leucine-rich repeat domain-containing protein [Holosporales bacterium]
MGLGCTLILNSLDSAEASFIQTNSFFDDGDSTPSLTTKSAILVRDQIMAEIQNNPYGQESETLHRLMAAYPAEVAFDLVFSPAYKVTSPTAEIYVMQHMAAIEMRDIWKFSESVLIRDFLESMTAQCTLLKDLNLLRNDLGQKMACLLPLTRLTSLSLSLNRISDQVSVLAELTNLQRLDLRDNRIGAHVIHLSGLSNLTALNLGGNLLGEHVTALRGMTNLTELDVSGNEIGESITALQGLTNLAVLGCSSNPIEHHVSTLRSLTNLTSFDITFCNIGAHVSALSDLTQLRDLRIGMNLLAHHASWIAQMQGLTFLDISNNDITQNDLIELQHLPKLRKIDITLSNLSEGFAQLKGFTALTHIRLNSACFSSISLIRDFIPHLHNLRRIKIDDGDASRLSNDDLEFLEQRGIKLEKGF